MRQSACSAEVDPAVPMPTMPSPPAARTAAASFPPATPPIGALTMGTRRPIARDQGVESIQLNRGEAFEDGQHDHRIVDCLQGMPLRRDDHVVAGLAIPPIVTGGEVHMSLQDRQRRLSGTVVFREFMPGKEGHHGLPQFVGVPPCNVCEARPLCACRAAASCSAARSVSETDSIISPSVGPQLSEIPQFDSRRTPPAINASDLITSRPM